MNSNEMVGSIAMRNATRGPLKLVLEPWGDETVIPANQSARVEFKGPQGGRIEVEVRVDAVAVYGWPGSVLEDSVLEAPGRA